jgi:hypothetical protein
MKIKTQPIRSIAYSKGSAKGKFIAMSAYVKFMWERSHIIDLMLHLNLTEKQEQAKPKISRREIIQGQISMK